MINRPTTMRLRIDDSVTRQQLKSGTVRRIIPYVNQYRWSMAVLVGITMIDAAFTVATPLLLRSIINNGILPRRLGVVSILSLTIAVLAIMDALAVYIQTRQSARIGEGLIYDLRTQVFQNVQRQSLAFFTRTQTGALVSRLNTDVVGAQQAFTSVLSQTPSTILTLLFVLSAMFYLSWQVTIIALIVIPLFAIPGRVIGKQLQRLTREGMQLDAALGSLANERFNVAGATLAKLYGRQVEETGLFARCAERVRDIAVATTVYGRTFFILMTLIAGLGTALLYGIGGALVVHGVFQLGTLVALVTLVTRLYGPINQMSSLQVNILTALVSFDRVFEVMDLKPLVTERPGAQRLSVQSFSDGAAPAIEFDRVCFRYPTAREVSLASLESIALPAPERADSAWTLQDVSFRIPSGKLTALVGPSGAGKTTIAYLISRLYDPLSGTVRICGRDIRDFTLQSLHDAIGVVTQDVHLFHDTVRANLTYARPGATERELAQACEAAHVWDLISSLPNGLDTVTGDRGYRLSGGEKQRIALARLLLKAPPVVVLDEATAHLDSESESAIQQALDIALTGRTSLVIAHRLSTVHQAHQILVVDEGRIRERGTHDELLSADGLYAVFYRTQFLQKSGAIEAPHRGLDQNNPSADGTRPLFRRGTSISASAPSIAWA